MVARSAGTQHPALLLLYLSNATIDGTVSMVGGTSTGPVSFAGATIGGSLLMRGAHLAGQGIAFDSPSLRIRRDVLADDGFTCPGAFRLDRAAIDGILTPEGAVLDGSGDAATNSLRVPGIAHGGLYTPDLILPVGDFGQQSAYHPHGATIWLAYTLIVAGLILATTVCRCRAGRETPHSRGR